MPIRRVWRQYRKALEPALAGIADLADHFLARQKTHQVNVSASETGYRRKGNDVDMGLLSDRLYRLDFGSEQGSEDQPCAVGDHGARRTGRAASVPAGVSWYQNHPVA